jgi:hypothetical protein
MRDDQLRESVTTGGLFRRELRRLDLPGHDVWQL